MPNEIFINRGNQSDCGNCDGVHPRQVAMWQVWSEKFSTCANWTHVTKFANKFHSCCKSFHAFEMQMKCARLLTGEGPKGRRQKLNLKPTLKLKLKLKSKLKLKLKLKKWKNLNPACISYESLNEIISKSISISPGNTRNWNLHLYEAFKQKINEKKRKGTKNVNFAWDEEGNVDRVRLAVRLYGKKTN